MSVDLLQQFLGGNQSDYADFLQRFQANPASISDQEASQRYQELMSKLPPDAAAQVHAQVLAQLSPEQRREIAQSFQQAHDDPRRPFSGFDAQDIEQAAQPRTLGLMSQRASAQDPGLFGQIFGQAQNSPLSGTLGKLLMSALVAYLTQRMMSGQANQRGGAGGPLGGQAGGMGGLGDILGGLLGGQAGGLGGQPSGQGGLDDILGGLLGGQAGGLQTGDQSSQAPEPPQADEPPPASKSHRKYK